jgi:eukaryotic-like serine/threonine-protein kinase
LRARDELAVGHRIGAYEIRRLIGRGEVATVYEGRHVTLGRPAAVKVLHAHLARNQATTARFLRECRALSRIEHPNVVEVFDVGEDNGVPYFVVALVDGGDLREYIHQHHPMPGTHVADCVLPIVSAVAAAYDAGVVERDVKPSHVRLTLDHRGALIPKVLDFGISKLTGDENGQKVRDSERMMEAASYLAPEQLRADKRSNARSDVYALGVLLYQALTGRRPFRGDSARDLMRAIVTAFAAPPSYYRPDIAPIFDVIVQRAMRPDPSERFATARDLGYALAPLSSAPEGWSAEFSPRSGNRVAAGNGWKNEPGNRSLR